MKIKHPQALAIYDLLDNLLTDLDTLSQAILDGLEEHAPETDRKVGELMVWELRRVAAPYRESLSESEVQP